MAIRREHLIRTEESLPSNRDLTQYTAWCGEKHLSNMFMTRSPTHHWLCPACSARYNEDRLKQAPNGFRLGERLDLSKDKRRYTYKSVYPVLDAVGQLVGYLTIENGWSKHWRVALLTVSGDDPKIEDPSLAVVMGKTLDGSWLSKQAFLVDVPRLVEQGHLKSADATLTAAKAYHARLRQRLSNIEADHKRTTIARTEMMDRIATGFAELLATDLTNLQRTAILEAAGLLSVKLPEMAE